MKKFLTALSSVLYFMVFKQTSANFQKASISFSIKGKLSRFRSLHQARARGLAALGLNGGAESSGGAVGATIAWVAGNTGHAGCGGRAGRVGGAGGTEVAESAEGSGATNGL